MPDFSMSNLAVAFSITLAAGLFTVLGSGLVMFSKTPNPRVLSFGLAFAGGAMVYVSLTEIFSKSSEAFAEIYDKDHAFAAATMAFLVGMGGIALIDRLVPNPHETLDAQDPSFQESKRRHIARVGMMAAFAITAHNFPEGLATFLPPWKIRRSGCLWPWRLPFIIFRRAFPLPRRFILPPEAVKNGMGVSAIRLSRAFGCGFGLFGFAAVFIACRVRFGVWRDSRRDGVFGVGRAAAGRQTLFRRP